jgi:16S rRNA (cytidine1402-2'-O)-methyltransferase
MSTLYLVATPIGNLEDITLRALRILREAPVIAAEDTRHTRKLLNHFGVATPTISYHEHSGPAGLQAMLERLAQGDVALVSDAGTPLISDPGQDLVQAALQAGHTIVPIPGPSALITALIASGLPSDQFTYLGFLPRRAAERRATLEQVRDDRRTLVLYEAPHRLHACLDDLYAILGDRQACLARELTKLHEEFQRGPLSQLLAKAQDESSARGEYTIVVAGATPIEPQPTDEADIRDALAHLLEQGLGTRVAATRVSAQFGVSRRDAYQLALEIARDAQR